MATSTFSDEPVPPPSAWPLVKHPEPLCDSHLGDVSCCAGPCTKVDAHDGPHECACGTQWGDFGDNASKPWGGFYAR